MLQQWYGNTVAFNYWILLKQLYKYRFNDWLQMCHSSSRSSESLYKCGPPAKVSDNRNFRQNFDAVMGNISEQIMDDHHYHFALHYVVSPAPQVYAYMQCHEDLSQTDCESCFSALKQKANRCLPSDSARIFLDGCFLRYDNYDFFGEAVDPIHDKFNCSARHLDDESLSKQFEEKVIEVITNVTIVTKRNGRFGQVEGKGGIATVYALAQCLKFLDNKGCSQCLDEAALRLKGCSKSGEGRAMFAGCYVRFSTERFFNPNYQKKETPEGDKISKLVMAGVCAFTFLSSIGACIGYKRLSEMRKGQVLLGTVLCTSSLNFKYEILERATDFFDNSRKLGQGGAGSVFRGTLPDGRNIAVKRLFFNSRQWVDQFFNEVNLISGIQHKNVVRLLGCSIEGPESLLVYEYVPNRSLDQILFVKNTIHILSWQQRFTIICGTAEGLAHLHGGSGIKIIHRDIKTSNILLDEKLTPKIADFGLARHVAPDKTHVSTGIAGTLGYMAPEYLVRGQLTEKADVYAFGVLVIEVASGRRNSVFSEGSSSVLHTVWKHYKANRITQSMDPGLTGRFPENEASRVLQIGLLCTQAPVALRPSMTEVVHMLNNIDYEIPPPKQPPFLNASVISPSDNSKDSMMSSFKSFVAESPEMDHSLKMKAFEPS
ncbi:cysteine-rich receptor-like protein kinase 1 [Citrus sinensis]|nr:cysteine-rich receptor-like protein kinase 1 [Citrus sinensis]